MVDKLKLSTKILLMGVGIIVSFSILLAWIFPRVKDRMYDAKYLKTRHVVETACGVLDYYNQKVEDNALSVNEAQRQAKQAIKHLRYQEQDYFWINDMEPKMIMHPMKTELDGRHVSNLKDPNGKRLFVAMVDVCRNADGGFVDYYWPKPGKTQPVPKISYVKLYPDWDWIVGSGIYIDDVEEEVAELFYTIVIVSVLIAIGAVLLSCFMARTISKPINQVILDLSDGAEQVARACGEVSSSNQSLAEGSSEQAASLEETASSLEQMSSMTKQNADNANQADLLMKETNEVATKANDSMCHLTTSMHDISNASEEISKIIKTIDAIAFQTNLLALNAAVEAARSGESGAGFAVVAEEVRKLAMSASDAAKNTSGLIEGTVQKINAGSELVIKTSAAFKDMAASASKVGELVGEISAASNEQADGIQQVSQAVDEMDASVQKAAANAEESASAAEQMNAQAEQMKSSVKDLVAIVRGHDTNGHSSQKACAG